MTEAEVQAQVQAEAVSFRCQLMRNNSGAMKDMTGRVIRFGLGNVSKKHHDQIKSSDLIGFTEVLVTQDMVGQRIAVFTAVECKAGDWVRNPKDKHENAQETFLNWIRARGGFAGFASKWTNLQDILMFRWPGL